MDVDGNEVKYEIPSHHYIMHRKHSSGEVECENVFFELDLKSYSKQSVLLLGDVFMQNWYTVFDRSSDTVGFARAVHSESETIY